MTTAISDNLFFMDPWNFAALAFLPIRREGNGITDGARDVAFLV